MRVALAHALEQARRQEDLVREPPGEKVEAAVEAFREQLELGYMAMVTTGPGHAEQVKELPVGEVTVILRLPIA